MSDGIRKVNNSLDQANQASIQDTDNHAQQIANKIEEKIQQKKMLHDVVEFARNSDNSAFSSILNNSSDLHEKPTTLDPQKIETAATSLLNQKLVTARLTTGMKTHETLNKAAVLAEEKAEKAKQMMEKAEELSNMMKTTQIVQAVTTTVVGVVNAVVNLNGSSQDEIKLVQVSESAKNILSVNKDLILASEKNDKKA